MAWARAGAVVRAEEEAEAEAGAGAGAEAEADAGIVGTRAGVGTVTDAEAFACFRSFAIFCS